MNDDPKWYLHEPFMLGADVPDGWEGRRILGDEWLSAESCHGWPKSIFETRPVPERMVTLPPLPESVVRAHAEVADVEIGRGVNSEGKAVAIACREAVEKLDGAS